MNVKVFSSILDYPHPGLDPYVWAQDGTLLPENKDEILGKLNDYLVQAGLRSPEKWITSLHIVGSLTTYQYARDTDVDLHIGINFPAFQKYEKPNLSAEEAEKFLDDLRKEASKEHRFLPNTQHPIEFYFLTPSAKEDTTHVGVYDLYTDKWLKAPVAINADFDIEQSQPKFIEDAMELAGEIDESLGKIKQHIRRVEDLQDVIKEWSPDKRKSFEQKLQTKLEAIEEEIDTLVKTKKQIQEQRKDVGFDPESEREVKFKYLQKFGYFFIISRLRDLFDAETEDVKVTEQDVPKIKEIVECPVDVKGSIGKQAHDVPVGDAGKGKLMIDFDNTIAVNSHDHKVESLEPGVKEALEQFKADGWYIVIYSARANREGGVDEIKDFMAKNQLPYDEIFVGKPDAELYIDDRNVVFTNWKDTVQSVEEHKKHASLNVSAQNGVKYDFTSTHFNMPKEVAQEILEWSVRNIPDEDLYDDGSGKFERELESHMTILFGLLTNDSTEVEKLLADEKPIRVKFGKTDVFEDDDKDAIFIAVDSKEAEDLHKKLMQLDNENQQPNYHPHVTVAYVKKGKGKKYVGKDVLGDLDLELSELKFSPKEGDPVFIALGKQKKEAYLGKAYWIDPNGKVYTVSAGATRRTTHRDWIVKNVEMLMKKYGLPLEDLAMVDDPNGEEAWAAMQTMFNSGWTRIGDSSTGEDWAVTLKDINKIPSNVEDILMGFVPTNADVYIEQSDVDSGDAEKSIAITWPPEHGLQHEVNKALHAPKQLAKFEELVDSFIQKKAALHWVDPETPKNVLQNSDVNRSTFKDFLSKGWVAVDEHSSPKRVLVDDLEFTPDWLDTYLGSLVGWGEDVELTDKHGNTVPIHFPTKNIKRQIQRKLYPPEDVTAAFMPSITQAPDNPWQPDSDVELPLDPDTVSEEETSNKDFLVDKPKKTLWRRILDMFTNDDDKEASVKKTASEARGWLSPNGQFFNFGDFDYDEQEGTTHADWVMDSLDFLKDTYQIDPKELEDSGDAVATLVDHGWIRISDDYHRLGVQVQTLANIPDFVTDHLNKTTAPGTEVTFEDLDGNWIETADWMEGAQKAVRRALQRKRMLQRQQQPVEGALKTAYLDHAYWIAPDNKVFVVRGGDKGNYSKYTHGSWAKRNREKLKIKYNLDIDPSWDGYEATEYMLDAGWIRIGDAQSGRGWAVMKNDIQDIPSKVDDVLSTFLSDGDVVAVEDLSSGAYVEVEYPFKSLQNEVRRQYRAQNQPKPEPKYEDVPIPEPEKAPVQQSEPQMQPAEENQPEQMELPLFGKRASIKTADVLTDILKIVKDTGGATYNFSTNTNLAGTANYAVSIYPEHTAIIDHELTVQDLYHYITSKRDLLLKPENSLGIWNNGGKYYLDVTLTIPDREKAIELGKKHNQISIFDLQNFQEIPTGGTGEVQSKKAKIGEVRVWLDPEGNVHELDEGQVHQDWAESYGVETGVGEISSYDLINDGWVRIGDAYEDDSAFNIELEDMRHIPDFVNDFIAGHYSGGKIEVEDHTGTVQINDPFPNLQKAVNHAIITKRQNKAALLSKISKSIEEVRGIKVLVNPTENELRNFWQRSREKSLRALVDPHTGDIFAWDAYLSEHNSIIRYYDLDIDWESDDGTYIRHVAHEPDIASLFAIQAEVRASQLEHKQSAEEITMPKDEFVKEHKRLLRVLKSPSHKDDLEEYERQKKELAEHTKTAAAEDEYWINPKGEVFHAPEGHTRWILQNLGTMELPASYFGVDIPSELTEEDAGEINEIREEMLRMGWVRIGSDEFGDDQFIVEVDNLKKIPSSVDNFIAEHFREGQGPIFVGTPFSEDGGLSIDNPFPTLQQAVNKALRRQPRRATLGLSKYARFQGTAWVDPKGKIFRVGRTHAHWVYDNLEMLENVYGYSISEGTPDTDPELLVRELLEYEWTRIADWTRGAGYIQIADLNQVPPGLQPFLDENYDWANGGMLVIDDISGTYAEVTVTGDIQEDINNALRLHPGRTVGKALSRFVEKHAFSAHAWWIAPDNQVYEVRGQETGRDTTHAEWVKQNRAMLARKYKIRLPKYIDTEEAFDVNSILIEKGWTRLGDYSGSQIGIRTKDIHHIPAIVDDLLASFAKEGERIHVEDINQEEYASVVYPFKTLQYAVNRDLREMEQEKQRRQEEIRRREEEDRQKRQKEDEALEKHWVDHAKRVEEERQREIERQRLQDVPIPEPVEEKQPEQMELPLSGKKAYEGPSTTWKNTEPTQPLPTTFTNDTNDDNLNSRYPWKFMRKPTGPDTSNEDEVNEMLVEEEEELPLSSRAMKRVARSDFAAWIDPNGKVYDVRSKGYGGTHLGWIESNTKLLRDEYRYELPSNEDGKWLSSNQLSFIFDLLLSKGWVRIGDSLTHGISLSIQLSDLRNIPSYVDDYIASVYEPGMKVEVEQGGDYRNKGQTVSLDTPFPTLQKAVNRAMSSQLPLAASLKKEAFASKYWIAPSGEFYKVHDTHVDWVKKHWNVLGFDKLYDVSEQEIQEEGAESIADQAYDHMIKDLGWARVGLDDHYQFFINVGNMMQLPSSVESFVEQFFDPNDKHPIWIVDPKQEVVLRDPIGNLQEKVKQELRYSVPHAASLSKHALTMRGYWVAPDGKVFEVRGDGSWDTHGNWVFDNLNMLKKKYGIKSADKNADYFTTAREMLEKGWVRIGDTQHGRGVVGIELANIKNVPSYVDDAVAAFAVDGELIVVADLNENWAEIRWPVKSIQSAVARNRGRRANLQKKASTHGWLAPDGKLYEFYDQNHAGWVRNNQKMLKKKYGISIKEGDFYDLVNSLVVHNWVRITGDLQDGFYVKDIHNIPDALVDFFEKNTPDVFLDFVVEDITNQSVTVNVEDALEKGLKEAIYDELKRPDIPMAANKKIAHSDKEIKDEAYGLWQQAVEAWEAKINPIEQAIIQNGGIAAYRPSAETGKVEEREEYRGIPVRLRGTTSYDEMIDLLKSQHLLDQDAGYGDLYDIISHLPERGHRPRWQDFIEEAKHNLEYEGALKRKAFQGHAYWIDPKGKVFEVRDKTGGYSTHWDWIRQSQDLLADEYDIQAPPTSSAPTDYLYSAMIGEGWTRIGDAGSYGKRWGVEVSDIHSIPSYVDDVLSSFLIDGNEVNVEDASGELARVVYPFKSLQTAVNQDLANEIGTKAQKHAGNESNTYSDDEMEKIYTEQHADEMKTDQGGGFTPRDFGDSSTDYPKPEDTQRKQKIQLDLLEPTQTPPIPSYEVTWYFGSPADDNGSM